MGSDFITIGNKSFKVSNIKEYGISSKQCIIYREYAVIAIYENVKTFFGKQKREYKGYSRGELLFEKILGVGRTEYVDFYSYDSKYYNWESTSEARENVRDQCEKTARKKGYKNTFIQSYHVRFAPTILHYEGNIDQFVDGEILFEPSLDPNREVVVEFETKSCKYFYCTTYQGDNTVFYEFDRHNIEKYLSEMKKAVNNTQNNFNSSKQDQNDFKKRVEKLKIMKEAGLLSEVEFQDEKQKLLRSI